MKQQRDTIASLHTLLRLRASDTERLQAGLAAQQRTLERFQHNLRRLATLYDGASTEAAGATALGALALNRGDYRQAVLATVATHRTDLALHQATMAIAQRALHAAWVKQEVLAQVVRQKEAALHEEQRHNEARRQDAIASAWCWRQRAAIFGGTA